MAVELARSQARCTTPSATFAPSGVTPERTGVSTDDHGWEKYSGTAGFPLATADQAESLTSTAYGWGLGYYFTNGQPSDGQFEEVVRANVIVTLSPYVLLTIAARLYNVSGTQKFRLWNVEADTQIGSDSAAVTVGQAMLPDMKIEESAETVELFLDGSSIISATALPTFLTAGAGLSAGLASTGTVRYWSAWCHYFSASDDLNEAHYPEMRLLHPNGDGNYTGYTNDDYTGWDDLAGEGNPDVGTYLVAGDAAVTETSTLTTHTMTNTIMAVVELLVLRADQATKTVNHFAFLRETFDKVVGFGTEDIGTSYVVREAVFHTSPSGASWTQGIITALEAGHQRVVASAAMNIRVTAMGVVVVALGTTNLAPPDPPGPPVPDLSWLQTSHRPRIMEPVIYAH